MTDFIYVFGPEVERFEDATWVSVDRSEYGVPMKIGYSSNPKANLPALLRGASHYCYWHIGWFVDYGRAVEKALHQVFEIFKDRREWFHLSYFDYSFIQQLTPDRVSSCCSSALAAHLACDLLEYRIAHRLPPKQTKFTMRGKDGLVFSINDLAPWLASPARYDAEEA
jgi:hypothetical protein